MLISRFSVGSQKTLTKTLINKGIASRHLFAIIASRLKVNPMQSDNLNIASNEALITPEQLKSELPLVGDSLDAVVAARQTIFDILDRTDPRLFVVVGPCSIHDTDAALDYARKLKGLADKVADTLYIVMRVYFEKPRTSIGWKGLINDPYLDDSFKIKDGLRKGRELLLDIVDIGLPTSTEALDPISPQYMQDIISWSAIGARTTESQTHREMSSGLSSAVGFKNGTDGGMTVAVNAMKSVESGHSFLGLSADGQVSVIRSKGNPYAHVVLRGGNGSPNYDAASVAKAEAELAKAGKPDGKLMIDSSHANSNKDPSLQPMVIQNVGEQIVDGNKSIVSLMVESHLKAGNQNLGDDKSKLVYGQSITDGCISWEQTEDTLRALREQIREAIHQR